VRLLLDPRRHRQAEELLPVGIDDCEQLSRSGDPTLLVEAIPAARKVGRDGDGDARETLHVRVVEQRLHRSQVLLTETLELDRGQGATISRRKPDSVAHVSGTRTLDGPLGLVGAGYIGHLFAQQFALGGYEVRAWSPGESARTLPERLRQSLSALADIGAVESSAIEGVLARVSTHDELATALAPCAAVMESIVEDADLKAACYQDVEAAVGDDVLLWSATSNFPMTRLAAGMARPERAVVVHPVQTQLIIFVEVVAGERTSDETVARTLRFCKEVGLRAVPVRKEIPGFLWNRVWFALLREMLHLVDIGAADPVELDSMVRTTLSAFIPVFGPLQMTDLIGHDTLRDISNALYPELANDQTASTTIEQHVRDNRLGVKSGSGFYDDNEQRVAELSRELYQLARRLERPT
jgi:3-hydroxybutyryl-CoA dehydrogenase